MVSEGQAIPAGPSKKTFCGYAPHQLLGPEWLNDLMMNPKYLLNGGNLCVCILFRLLSRGQQMHPWGSHFETKPDQSPPVHDLPLPNLAW